MASRTGRETVVGRGVAAAAIATFVAALSHSAAAGAPPSGWSIVVAFVVASVVCVSLAGRRLSWTRLSIAVASSQVFFHLLLSIGFGDANAASGAPTMAPHHGVMSLVGTATPEAMSSGVSPAMWAAHLGAAMITVLAIGTAEKTAAAVLSLARRPFRMLRPVAVPTRDVPQPPVPPVRVFSPRLIDLSVVRRRGPPVFG